MRLSLYSAVGLNFTWGAGGRFNAPPPRLILLLGHVATRGKRLSKEGKNESMFIGHFSARSKARLPEIRIGEILSILAIFDKLAHNSRMNRATAPRKSAFDSSL